MDILIFFLIYAVISLGVAIFYLLANNLPGWLEITVVLIGSPWILLFNKTGINHNIQKTFGRYLLYRNEFRIIKDAEKRRDLNILVEMVENKKK